MSDSIRLTRQELYDRVWSAPANKVGPELGMSGRGLAKLCVREGIPVPTRGYWAKKEFGWSPTQAKLPPRKPSQSETIEFSLGRSDASLEVENAKPAPDPVPVAVTLEQPHPVVAATLKASRIAKKQADGRIALPGDGHLGLEVSRDILDRALRIADALIKALAEKGCTIRPVREGKKPAVAIGPDAVEFWFVEKLNRTERALSKTQIKEKERHPWMYSRPEYDYAPAGLLTLHLEEIYGSGVRRTWGDGSKARLEALLPRAVEGILKLLASRRAAREEREEQARRREEQERQRVARAMEQFQDDRRAAIVERRLQWLRLAGEIKEWSSGMTLAAPGDPPRDTTNRWSEWIVGYVAGLEAASRKLPDFEAEPTYEDRTKYGLYSRY